MIERTFKFDGSEFFFQGHFPEAPVLPGVIQLSIARELAEELVGAPLKLKAVKKMKFAHIICPGDEVKVAVSRKGENSFVYELTKGGLTCSSGVLVC